jgi:hypothetical protein
MDLNKKYSELLELHNSMKLNYTCYYIVRKIEHKNQYHFGFFISPEQLIIDILKETGIETEFVIEVAPKKHTKRNEDGQKVINFNVWYAKKYKVPIETHQTSYKEYPVHFLTLTDEQVEKLIFEYDAYIEQLSVSDKNPNPIVKQATLF